MLPLGSWEQHGAHLPLDTDSRIIAAVVNAALDLVAVENPHGIGEFLVAPVLPITASDEHASFAGTLSMGTDATTAAIVSIARSASWARGVCIANGHGGNADSLGAVHDALSYEGINHSIWYPSAETSDDMHAGHTETSLMLHIAPESVRTDRIEAGARSADNLVQRMRDGGVFAVAPNGVIGDPRTATASDGAQLLDRYARSLADRLRWCANQWPPHAA